MVEAVLDLGPSLSVGDAHGVKLYNFARLKADKLNPKLSRGMVVGQNEMLGYVLLKKGCYVPAHKHVSEQITILTKGALKFEIGGKEMVVKAGECLVIPPNVEHAALALKDTVDIDCFSPLREDWLTGTDSYLRGGRGRKK